MSFNISYLTQHIQNTIILTCYNIKTINEMFCIFFLTCYVVTLSAHINLDTKFSRVCEM